MIVCSKTYRHNPRHLRATPRPVSRVRYAGTFPECNHDNRTGDRIARPDAARNRCPAASRPGVRPVGTGNGGTSPGHDRSGPLRGTCGGRGTPVVGPSPVPRRTPPGRDRGPRERPSGIPRGGRPGPRPGPPAPACCLAGLLRHRVAWVFAGRLAARRLAREDEVAASGLTAELESRINTREAFLKSP